ncbi:Uncharacterised protein [Salmonella enterica subsp. enterica serovar Typhi]|nr:Uncharacterised protein [Salmonella enterica subsp. enterica serovar Typhi]CGV07606.1 Uncharacterised protein [Salmonella enterica subsp. enterica serovar Typhi]CRD07201.1 Uncharacterised protein [Salmonella enterica subsp. enterica serovar Typhi]CRF89650.1 Uncharacterised protein [Salmonella enterica subsp. enterica serovar Typhi]CWZ17500.1 Uncharacterised protein [Salmonella enterica subsp. enterica serovar Typhi]
MEQSFGQGRREHIGLKTHIPALKHFASDIIPKAPVVLNFGQETLKAVETSLVAVLLRVSAE